MAVKMLEPATSAVLQALLLEFHEGRVAGRHGGGGGWRCAVRGQPRPAERRREQGGGSGLAVERHAGRQERGHEAVADRQPTEESASVQTRSWRSFGQCTGPCVRVELRGGSGADRRVPPGHLLPPPLLRFQPVPRHLLLRLHQRGASLHVGGQPRPRQHLQARAGGAAAARDWTALSLFVELGGAGVMHWGPAALQQGEADLLLLPPKGQQLCVLQ